MIALITITFSTACNKEVSQPYSNMNESNKTSATTLGNPSAITKKPIGYTGGTGTSDSTKTTTNP